MTKEDYEIKVQSMPKSMQDLFRESMEISLSKRIVNRFMAVVMQAYANGQRDALKDLEESYRAAMDNRYADGLEDMRQAFVTMFDEMQSSEKAKYFGSDTSPDIMRTNGPHRIMCGVEEYRKAKQERERDEKAEKLKNLINEFGVDELYKAVCELKEQEERVDEV